jgi:hypothetical protein
VIHPYTKLRMVRPGIARAVVEDGMVVVYHCMDNSRCDILLNNSMRRDVTSMISQRDVRGTQPATGVRAG